MVKIERELSVAWASTFFDDLARNDGQKKFESFVRQMTKKRDERPPLHLHCIDYFSLSLTATVAEPAT